MASVLKAFVFVTWDGKDEAVKWKVIIRIKEKPYAVHHTRLKSHLLTVDNRELF